MEKRGTSEKRVCSQKKLLGKVVGKREGQKALADFSKLPTCQFLSFLLVVGTDDTLEKSVERQDG